MKTGSLVGAIALIAFLPVGRYVLGGESASALTARADATPLLVGARGSSLELVLSSLYFGSEAREQTRVESGAGEEGRGGGGRLSAVCG